MADPKVNINESFTSDFETSLREVEALSDEELYDKLVSSGKEIGPVVGTTRRLYQKQLATIISSPGGVLNSTNGNADDQNGDVSDSDDASFETSSRASRSSRGSSLPKKIINPAVVANTTRASSKSKQVERPNVVETEESESPQKRETFSTYTTPNRSTRTFEDYVAESERKKALLGDSYLRRQQAQERSSVSRAREVEPPKGLNSNLKVFVLLAILAAVAAYIYFQFGQTWLGLDGPKDRDSIIDKEIEELTKTKQ